MGIKKIVVGKGTTEFFLTKFSNSKPCTPTLMALYAACGTDLENSQRNRQSLELSTGPYLGTLRKATAVIYLIPVNI
jgi:hypothetical protein